MNRNLTIAATLALFANLAGAQTFWDYSDSEDWNSAVFWNPMDVPDTPQESVHVGLFDHSGPVLTDSTIEIGSLSIDNPLAHVVVKALDSDCSLTIHGDLHNDGTLNISPNSNTFSSTVVFASTTEISGTGRLLLNRDDVTELATSNGATLTNGPGHTIWGSGRVTAHLINEGYVGDYGTQEWLGYDKVNNALMVADNYGGFDIHSITIEQGPNGVMRAGGGNGHITIVEDANAAIVGGTIETEPGNSGRVEVQSGATLTLHGANLDARVTVRPAGTLAVGNGGINNDRIITISGDSREPATRLLITTDTIIDGTGEIHLSSSAPFSSLTTDSGVSATIGEGQRITGRGELSGALLVEGTIAPENTRPPIMAVEGDLQLGPTAVYEMAIASTNSSSYVQLIGGGVCDLDGVLRVLLGNYTPSQGDEFEVMRLSQVTGRFGAIESEPLPAGLGWRVVYEPTQVRLRVTCMGDFDGDGTVNTRDVLEFLNAWVAGEPSSDVNLDGAVNTRDVLDFLNAWTAGC